MREGASAAHDASDAHGAALRRLGSTEVCMKKVTGDLHAALLADARLAPVFSKIDMEGLSREQAHFMELAMAGDAEEECARPALGMPCMLLLLLLRPRDSVVRLMSRGPGTPAPPPDMQPHAVSRAAASHAMLTTRDVPIATQSPRSQPTSHLEGPPCLQRRRGTRSTWRRSRARG